MIINASILQDWLTEIFSPCAIVYSSDRAKKSISKNYLNQADFMWSFGDFKGKKIELFTLDKTSTSSNSIIRNFKIDTYDNNKFKIIQRKDI